ncbi:MAG: hypothetical protein Ct9H300mP29_8810 [Candidatus Neomarinimicrobiota bacterium]|nr:MAG: hypothetical protein Ct9H300mP29_8810 [Candidatus Neomarinimicrobiota bacterium]
MGMNDVCGKLEEDFSSIIKTRDIWGLYFFG